MKCFMIILHPCCQARLHSRKMTSAVTLTSEHCPSQPFPRSIGCRWRSVFLIIATNTLSLHNIPLFFIFPTLYVQNCNKETPLPRSLTFPIYQTAPTGRIWLWVHQARGASNCQCGVCHLDKDQSLCQCLEVQSNFSCIVVNMLELFIN